MKRLGYDHVYLYLVQYRTGQGKMFFKIGLSVSPETRVNRKGHSGNLLGAVCMDIKQAWAKESYVLTVIYRNKYSYCPSKGFDGKTECFNIKGYEATMPFLNKLGMKLKKIEPIKRQRTTTEQKMRNLCLQYSQRCPHIKRVIFDFSVKEVYNEELNIYEKQYIHTFDAM